MTSSSRSAAIVSSSVQTWSIITARSSSSTSFKAQDRSSGVSSSSIVLNGSWSAPFSSQASLQPISITETLSPSSLTATTYWSPSASSKWLATGSSAPRKWQSRSTNVLSSSPTPISPTPVPGNIDPQYPALQSQPDGLLSNTPDSNLAQAEPDSTAETGMPRSKLTVIVVTSVIAGLVIIGCFAAAIRLLRPVSSKSRQARRTRTAGSTISSEKKTTEDQPNDCKPPLGTSNATPFNVVIDTTPECQVPINPLAMRSIDNFRPSLRVVGDTASAVPADAHITATPVPVVNWEEIVGQQPAPSDYQMGWQAREIMPPPSMRSKRNSQATPHSSAACASQATLHTIDSQTQMPYPFERPGSATFSFSAAIAQPSASAGPSRRKSNNRLSGPASANAQENVAAVCGNTPLVSSVSTSAAASRCPSRNSTGTDAGISNGSGRRSVMGRAL